jgi:hypothetical protein
MVHTGPRESRNATEAEFRFMLSLQPRITAMAKELFGEDFDRVEPEQFEEPYLELGLKKGTPNRNRHNLEEFRGWLALFAFESSPNQPEDSLTQQ